MGFPDELVTLPRDHGTLFFVPNTDDVLRRFNPDNEDIRDVVSVDEGGVTRYRLKSGALTGFSDDGCSVGRDQILREAELDRAVMLHPKHRKLAEAAVDAIRDLVHPDSAGEERQPFDVAPDAYPASDPNPQRWQVAHALITLAEGYTRSARTTAVGTLARTVFNPLVTP
ncbi:MULTISPECIES: hypothetical protein [Microbacterium]|uniref:hypothetical protein n=1 Tax=Microbacterium TaxID=33882 RepID=UPI00344DF6C2